MILFAKAPVAGRVKTRLAPRIGAEAAAELHRACVRDMLERLGAMGGADLFLHTDIPTDAWQDVPVARKLQHSGDLALKMVHALEESLAEGRPQAVIVGSDAPTLPRAHVERLLASRADVVFGPAEDGGYYAIGCRRIHREMFRGVEWSGAETLAQSERAAQACGLRVERGPGWWDVDAPADLDRLMAAPDLPRFTAAWRERFYPC